MHACRLLTNQIGSPPNPGENFPMTTGRLVSASRAARTRASDEQRGARPAVKEAAEAEGKQLHRCAFVPYQPSAIQKVAFSPSGTYPLVAVLRGTASSCVEIIDPQSDWLVERRILGRQGEGFECFAWIGPQQQEAAESSDSDSDADLAVAPVAAEPAQSLEGVGYAKALPVSSKNLCSKRVLLAAGLPRARFVTAGVDGRIREWALAGAGAAATEELRFFDVVGGAIWCLAVSPDQKKLAVGSEDGRVRLYSIHEYGFEFERGFECFDEGRVLCLSWGLDGQYLASGSALGLLKVWDVGTGRAMHSIRLDRAKPHVPTAIWALAALAGDCLATGDSTGHVQFWDARTGCQLQSLRALAADVLVLAAGPNGRTLFASGVDGKHVYFAQAQGRTLGGLDTVKWSHGGTKRMHTSDVRGMGYGAVYAEIDGRLCRREVVVSGGLDCGLIVADAGKFDSNADLLDATSIHRHIVPFPRAAGAVLVQKQTVSADTERIAALLPDKNCIQVYDLHAGGQISFLACIKLSRRDPIVSYALAAAGDQIAVLLKDQLRVFNVTGSSVAPVEQAIELPIVRGAAFPHLCAYEDGALYLASSKQLFVVNCDGFEVKESCAIDSGVFYNSMSISPCTTQAAFTSSAANTLHVYRLDAQTALVYSHEFTHPVTLASFSAPGHLVVMTVGNQLFLMKEDGTGAFSLDTVALPKAARLCKEPFVGVARGSGRLSLWCAAGILQLPQGPAASSRKRQQTESSGTALETRFVSDFKSLLYFSYTGADEPLLVERPWSAIAAGLPASFYRARYGAQ